MAVPGVNPESNDGSSALRRRMPSRPEMLFLQSGNRAIKTAKACPHGVEEPDFSIIFRS
jgi:hypothetical protein